MATPTMSWVPESEAEKRALEEQLEKVLAHSVFRSSKRCAALLRHVVVSALKGQAALLKERTLGVEVFGRDAAYETNLDPVVRTTAGEVRKRIAQYYHEAGHASEIRIDLPAGSYVPEFHLPAELPLGVTMAPAVVPSTIATSGRRWLAIAILLAVVCAVAIVVVALWMRRPAIETLWQPLLNTSSPVLIVIGEPPHPQIAASDSAPSVATHITSNNHVALADAVALSRIAGFLGNHRKAYSLQDAQSTNFTDLQHGPAVLISGLDNSWTTRLTEPLRFHFRGEAPERFWIEDRTNPANKDRMVNYAVPYSSLTQDYAIVARFTAPETGQVTIVAAGIGDNATTAAGEFLTNRDYADLIANVAPKGWESKNLELVLATQVIDGRSGPPRIVAVETW